MTTGWSAADLEDLAGRVYVITGANSGIGLEASSALAGAGARVVMACRSEVRANAAAEHIRASHPDASLTILPLDLSSLESIRWFADLLGDATDRVDGLINNAGVIGIRGDTADGFEMTIGVNHLGHFALTGLILPHLESTARSGADSRVVNVASIAHRWFGKMHWDDLEFRRRRWNMWPVYGQSKLANLLFTFELDRRLRTSGSPVRSVACHPGMSHTNLIVAGAAAEGRSVVESVLRFGSSVVTQPARKGALPTVFAAVDASVEGGDYIGPAGLLETRGWPVKVKAAKKAHRVQDQERLWEWSSERTGISYL